MLAYDAPVAQLGEKTDSTVPLSENIIGYNLHNLYSQNRFFVFSRLTNTNTSLKKKKHRKIGILPSMTELYPNAWWLEREIAELHEINFTNKKDTRNLMLQYGDTSAPFKKNSPSIGLKEIFYDAVSDSLVHNPVSLQF